MIGITKIEDAAAAFSYYRERDDYYLADKSAAAWYGRGTARLGLAGDIDPADLRDLLAGRHNGVQFVGREGCKTITKIVKLKDGGTKEKKVKVPNHLPGYDVTFSAPKSVSVAGLVEGDKGWLNAHDQAARKALDYIQQHASFTRQRGAGGQYEYRQTGELTAAIVRHSTSREGDPQVHSHCLIANALYDQVTGRWVSIDSRELYKLHAEANNIYMNELAAYAREHGEEIVWHVNEKGMVVFDLARIPREIIEGFSTRTKRIDEKLEERGTDREHASGWERQKASFDTRSPKERLPTAEWHRRWMERARELGFSVVARALGRDPSFFKDRDANADAAIASGIAHLSERQTRFTERELLASARTFAQGRAQDTDLTAAVTRAHATGILLDRETEQDLPGNQRGMVAGFTTTEAVRTEQSMLDRARQIARSGIGQPRIGESYAGETTPAKIDALIARREAETGHKFTTEMRAAVHEILESECGFHNVQGHAGTAKTDSVLWSLSAQARAGGWQVKALAATHDAANVLSASIGAEAGTVAAAILKEPDAAMGRQLWIVDESSLVGAGDANKLFARAAKVDARVVFTGDWQQISSVTAGAAFRQNMEAGVGETHTLTDIKRQTVEELRAAVYDAIEGRPGDALKKVEVAEHKAMPEAVAAVADDYMQHFAAGDKTLVVTLSIEDRDAVNAAIQQRREAAGEVSDVREVATLDVKDWSEEEQSDAARYSPGDVIEALRNFTRGPSKGELATVEKIEGGKITALLEDGSRWTFSPKRVAKFTVSDRGTTRMGVGDLVVVTGAIHARDAEGRFCKIETKTTLTVRSVGDDGRIDVADRNGRTLTIDSKQGARLGLAYAQTTDSAQGRTVDIAIAWLRSTQRKLANLQRLYVILSRARRAAIVHTDDVQKLAERVSRNSGQKETAMLPRLDAAHVERGTDRTGQGQQQHAKVAESPKPWQTTRKPGARDRVRSALAATGHTLQRGVYALGEGAGKLDDAMKRHTANAPRRQFDRETKKILRTIKQAGAARRKSAAFKRSLLTGKVIGKRSIVNPVRIVKSINASAHEHDAVARVKGAAVVRHAGFEAHDAHHRLAWRDPKAGKLLVRTSDGKTARSTDHGKTWRQETGVKGLIDHHQAKVQADRSARLDADQRQWRAAGWKETTSSRTLARAALETHQRERDRILPIKRDWEAMADRYGVEYDRDGRRYAYDREGNLHAEALTSRAYVMERTEKGREVRDQTNGHTAGVLAGMGARREIERAINAGQEAEIERLKELAGVTQETERQAEREAGPAQERERETSREIGIDLELGGETRTARDSGHGQDLDLGR